MVGPYSVLWAQKKEGATANAQETKDELNKQEIEEETKLECITHE